MVEQGACSSGSGSGSNSSSSGGVNETNASTVNGVSNVVREGEIAGVVFEGARLEELTSLRRASGARFSLFKWFKRAGGRGSTIEKRRKVVDKIAVRGNKDDREEEEEEEDDDEENDGRRRSVSSSAESINTFYSTTTVRSFAFHSGALIAGKELSLDILNQAAEVGPFAAGASKVVGNKENNTADVACTLPSNVHSRRRDITARYSLQPTTSFASCGNLPLPEGRTLSASLRRLQDRGKEGGQVCVRRKVHVKGKRRAPNPPDVSRNSVEVDARVDAVPKNSNRRKRRAPRPPPELDTDGKANSGERSLSLEEGEKPIVADGGMDVDSGRKQEEGQVIGNDTLVLQGGVLHSRKDLKQSPKLSKSPTASSSSTGGCCGGGTGASGANCGIIAITQDTPGVQAVVAGATGTLSTAMPRPWYKRSVFEHSRDSAPSRRGDVLRVSAAGSIDSKEECVGTHTVSSSSTSSSSGLLTGTSTANYSVDASLSRLSFFHRGERQAEDRKRDVKRKSGLSILTNISELDKEAAAIVQEEQARARASMLLKSSKFTEAFERRHEMNEELVQDMVASAMETSSPKRGTRALISKFNAISNITKVTVNANFFARRDQQGTKFEQDVIRNARFEQTEWKENSKFQRASGVVGETSTHVDKDISRYFLPQQRRTSGIGESKEIETRMVSESKFTPRKDNNDRLIKETSSRISFLQSQLVANRMNEPLTSRTESTVVVVPTMEEKIKSKQEVVEEIREKERKTDNPASSGLPSFSKPRGLALERVENALGKDSRKPTDRGSVEAMQKEFSNIFEEIDRQLRITKEPRRTELESRREAKERAREEREKVEKAGKEKEEEERAKGKEKEKVEEGISSKVTKVLDILVEAEKDGKAKKAITRPTRSIFTEEEATVARLNEPEAKFGKTKSSLLNTVENPRTTDLKEMLKEMKHSLPKRPKPKKRTIEEENESGVEATRVELDVVPSTSKISYVAKSVLKKEASPLAARHDYEMDKQKVSSSSQTSGNVRRLNQPSTSTSAGWRQEDVLYRTSGKSVAGLALAKNTFQLIRPRDFAEIEAIKATKGQYKENTYANVIERSLYANALVPPSTNQRDEYPSRVKGELGNDSGKGLPNASSPSNERKFSAREDRFATTDEEDVTTEKNMNTLAINRLLRKLEAAIASGHHQQAAGLAKELARLKIHCSVIRQRTARLKDRAIKVNMYIEDKLAHQGPIPLQLPTRMTVAELKTKVYTEFEIPTNVQRWIIGKNLADYDEATLEELQAVDGSPIFLYLVAPELQKDSAVQADKSNSVEELQKVEKEVPLRTEEKVPEGEEEEDVRSIDARNDAAEVEAAEEQTPEEAKMERYEELISLENCDVIPNSEPIECPICFVTYGPREGVILRDCLHMFCKPCIENTIKYCEEAEVKCPYRDTEYTCESTLQEREIKALVEPEVYQQHLAKSIAQAETNAGNNAFHCKTPDCPGWCYYDDDVNNFLCPVCGINNCLTCQAAHIGKNCKQYQQELRLSKETDQESRRTAAMLEEMVDRGEALACPTCAVVLMKKWGCDWLRCSMCKTEICWVTRGPRWGPGGKGDTSGGCRCGENGVKCHPRCNYCH